MTFAALAATLAGDGPTSFSFGEKIMVRFKTAQLFLMLVLIASGSASAANFCVAVNKGFGHGGTSYVGPSFVLPSPGNCKPWAGFTKTASSVIATATGTGCISSNGKVLTLSIFDADPQNFGAGVAPSDYIQLCPKGVTNCTISGSDEGNFNGKAEEETCTDTLLKLPVTHD
jgi:hypothetical protein